MTRKFEFDNRREQQIPGASIKPFHVEYRRRGFSRLVLKVYGSNLFDASFRAPLGHEIGPGWVRYYVLPMPQTPLPLMQEKIE